MAPVLVGGGLAWAGGVFVALPFVAALTGAVLIQVGTNFANDYSDFIRGADSAGRLGAPRVTQSGLMSPTSVRRAAALAFGSAVMVGAYLVVRGGWPVAWIGIAAIAAGVAYTGGPWPFGYHGLGDVFAFLFFGPVAVAGTVYVQTLEWSLDAILAGVGVGALVTAILVVNNLRDRETDRSAGKRTLAVRIGVGGSRIQYVGLLGIAAATPVAGVAMGAWPVGVLLATGALVTAVSPLRIVLSYRDPRDLNAALARTALSAGIYGSSFALGCLL